MLKKGLVVCNEWRQLTASYLLEGDVGEPAADTLDGGDGEHGVPLTLQVRVHHTEDVLEVVEADQRHLDCKFPAKTVTKR